MTMNRSKLKTALVLLGVGALIGCARTDEAQPGQVQDEARRAGRTVVSLPAADEDYFHDMDGVSL